MKTYKEYYNSALIHHEKWLKLQKKEWWKNPDNDRNFKTKGEYFDYVNFLTIDEKNNAPIIENSTNIKNREWSLLFNMLGCALIDWCVETNETDIYAYNLKINREIVNLEDVINYSHEIKMLDDGIWCECDDENKLNKFSECSAFLTDLVCEFISHHGKDIPLDWNIFEFALDNISSSCKCKTWGVDSDGHLIFGNIDKTDNPTVFVCCM